MSKIICTTCGLCFPEGCRDFCPDDGTALLPFDEGEFGKVKSVACRQCGVWYHGGEKFCVYDGADLGEPSVTACPTCGAKYSNNELHCRLDGTVLPRAGQSEPSLSEESPGHEAAVDGMDPPSRADSRNGDLQEERERAARRREESEALAARAQAQLLAEWEEATRRMYQEEQARTELAEANRMSQEQEALLLELQEQEQARARLEAEVQAGLDNRPPEDSAALQPEEHEEHDHDEEVRRLQEQRDVDAETEEDMHAATIRREQEERVRREAASMDAVSEASAAKKKWAESEAKRREDRLRNAAALETQRRFKRQGVLTLQAALRRTLAPLLQQLVRIKDMPSVSVEEAACISQALVRRALYSRRLSETQSAHRYLQICASRWKLSLLLRHQLYLNRCAAAVLKASAKRRVRRPRQQLARATVRTLQGAMRRRLQRTKYHQDLASAHALQRAARRASFDRAQAAAAAAAAAAVEEQRVRELTAQQQEAERQAREAERAAAQRAEEARLAEQAHALAQARLAEDEAAKAAEARRVAEAQREAERQAELQRQADAARRNAEIEKQRRAAEEAEGRRREEAARQQRDAEVLARETLEAKRLAEAQAFALEQARLAAAERRQVDAVTLLQGVFRRRNLATKIQRATQALNLWQAPTPPPMPPPPTRFNRMECQIEVVGPNKAAMLFKLGGIQSTCRSKGVSVAVLQMGPRGEEYVAIVQMSMDEGGFQGVAGGLEVLQASVRRVPRRARFARARACTQRMQASIRSCLHRPEIFYLLRDYRARVTLQNACRRSLVRNGYINRPVARVVRRPSNLSTMSPPKLKRNSSVWGSTRKLVSATNAIADAPNHTAAKGDKSPTKAAASSSAAKASPSPPKVLSPSNRGLKARRSVAEASKPRRASGPVSPTAASGTASALKDGLGLVADVPLVAAAPAKADGFGLVGEVPLEEAGPETQASGATTEPRERFLGAGVADDDQRSASPPPALSIPPKTRAARPPPPSESQPSPRHSQVSPSPSSLLPDAPSTTAPPTPPPPVAGSTAASPTPPPPVAGYPHSEADEGLSRASPAPKSPPLTSPPRSPPSVANTAPPSPLSSHVPRSLSSLATPETSPPNEPDLSDAVLHPALPSPRSERAAPSETLPAVTDAESLPVESTRLVAGHLDTGQLDADDAVTAAESTRLDVDGLDMGQLDVDAAVTAAESTRLDADPLDQGDSLTAVDSTLRDAAAPEDVPGDVVGERDSEMESALPGASERDSEGGPRREDAPGGAAGSVSAMEAALPGVGEQPEEPFPMPEYPSTVQPGVRPDASEVDPESELGAALAPVSPLPVTAPLPTPHSRPETQHPEDHFPVPGPVQTPSDSPTVEPPGWDSDWPPQPLADTAVPSDAGAAVSEPHHSSDSTTALDVAEPETPVDRPRSNTSTRASSVASSAFRPAPFRKASARKQSTDSADDPKRLDHHLPATVSPGPHESALSRPNTLPLVPSSPKKALAPPAPTVRVSSRGGQRPVSGGLTVLDNPRLSSRGDKGRADNACPLPTPRKMSVTAGESDGVASFVSTPADNAPVLVIPLSGGLSIEKTCTPKTSTPGLKTPRREF